MKSNQKAIITNENHSNVPLNPFVGFMEGNQFHYQIIESQMHFFIGDTEFGKPVIFNILEKKDNGNQLIIELPDENPLNLFSTQNHYGNQYEVLFEENNSGTVSCIAPSGSILVFSWQSND